MTRDRNRSGRRKQTGGRREDYPLGYFDAREAAMEHAEYEEIMRFVPANFEAEAALLGALMIDNRLVERVGMKLTPDHFVEPTHARVYDRILTLVGKGKLASPVTLRPYFAGESFPIVDEKTQETKDQPIAHYLAQLTGSPAALIGATAFADQIVDLAALREIIGIAREAGERCANTKDEIDPRAVIQEAESKLFDVAASLAATEKTGSTWDAATDETIREAEAIAAGQEIRGITINGYDDWNHVVGRMEPEDYILLGGRPSMGKTAVACAVGAGAAMAGHATDFLSLEMPGRLISRRILANMIFDQGRTSTYSEQSEGRFTREDLVAIANDRVSLKDRKIFMNT